MRSHANLAALLLALFVLPGHWLAAQVEPKLEDYGVLDLLDMPAREREEVVTKICQRGHSKFVPLLLDVLAEDSQMEADIRRKVIRALELTVEDEHVSRLKDMALGENEQAALTAIGLCGLVGSDAAVGVLARQLSSKTRAKAVQAALALGRSRNPKARVPLAAGTAAADPSVKAAAKCGLASLKRTLGEERLELFPDAPEFASIAVLTSSDPPSWIKRSGWHSRVFCVESKFEELKACDLVYVPSASKELCGKVFADANAKAAVRAALANGATLLVEHGAVSPSLEGFLKSVQVSLPTGFTDAKGECQPSPADFTDLLTALHGMYAWTGRLRQRGGWATWSASQLGVMRSKEKPNLASMVVQHSVAGKGRVIFNACDSLTSLIQFRDNLFASLLPSRPYRADKRNFTVSEEVVTPHARWARPLAGGALRVLFILPEGPRATQKRTAVALAQRMELEYEFCPLLCTLLDKSKKRFSLNTASYLAIQQALVERPEVIVIGNASGLYGDNATPFNRSWRIFPYDLKRQVLRAVRSGAGLIFLSDPGEVPMQTMGFGSPEAVTIEATLGKLLSTGFRDRTKLGSFGRGRVAIVQDTGAATFGQEFLTPGLLAPRLRIGAGEYYWSALAKLALWASRRERPAALRSADVQHSDDGTAALRLSFTQALPGDARYSVEVRDKYNRVTTSSEGALPKPRDGATLVPIDIGQFAGPGVVRLRVLDRAGHALDWASNMISRKAKVAITNCRLDKDLYANGDTIRGRVQVGGDPMTRAVCRLVDTNGRVMAEHQPEATAEGEMTFELPVRHPVTRLAYIQVEAVGENGKPMGFERFPVVFDQPLDPHRFIWLVWGDCGPYRVQRQVLGTDYVFFGDNAEGALEAGIGLWQSGLGPGAGRPNGEKGVRKPCLSSPAFNMGIRSAAQKAMPTVRRGGTKIFMLQDESVLGSQYCRSLSCLVRFRRYLRDEYGSLVGLNRAWETELKTWDEVMPMSLEQVKGRRTFGPFVDHRAFMDDVYAGWVGAAEREIREYVPDARVGLSGVYGASTTGGFDAWKMSRTMTLAIKYLKCQHQEYERCLARPDMILSRWYAAGYSTSGRNEAAARYEIWRQLFHESNALSFWARRAYLSGDLTPFGPARWAAEESKEIKAGIDELILGADRHDFGIAIHYSQASWRISAVLGAARQDGADRLFTAASRYERVLGGLRLQYTYVASRQVEVGELIRRKYKVIILPYSVAISDREIMELTRFVEGGGTVIADFLPGDYDVHGVPRAKNPMLTLFGLARTETRGAGDVSLQIGEGHFGPAVQGTEAQVNGYASDLACTDSRAAAKVGSSPAMIHRRVGKGNAVLLNFHPYYARKDKDDAKTGQGIMLAVLRHVGVEPAFAVEPDVGSLRTYYYRRGQAAIVALHHTPTARMVADQSPVAYRLSLPQKAHVYAIRRGRYVGEAKEINDQITPAIAQLYALLPYRVTDVKARAAAARAGELLTIPLEILATQEPADHVIRTEVKDATGRVRPEYAQTVVAASGKGSAVLPLALNDPPGRWTLTARDVMTGVTGQAQIEIAGEKE